MKKSIILVMILLIAISLLAACGGKSGNETPSSTKKHDNVSSTPASGDGGAYASVGSDGSGYSEDDEDDEPANAAGQGDVAVDYDRVIYDDNGMKVTLTGYKHELGSEYISEGFYWYFTVENQTGNEINTQFANSSVNGCMYELEQSVVRSGAGETVESGRKIWLRAGDLNARGITAIESFEFILRFEGKDGSKWVTHAASEPITLAAPEPLDPGFKQVFDAEGVVVVDKAGIKVTAIRVDYDIISDTHHGIWMFVENNSGYDAQVVGICDKVNDIGKSFDADMFCSVMNGKVAYCYIEINKQDFEENGGVRIETTELSFYADELTSDEDSNPLRLIGNTGDQTTAAVSFGADGKAG